jgi:glycerophosphoryl diester phosphodiesterase
MTRPLFLGHRGARASRQIAENTLASFELCLRHGCDGFEFDVRLSADGQAVICHDAIRRGDEDREDGVRKSLALPTLEDVLGQFAQRAFLDIELKVAGLAPQTVAVLRKHPPQNGYVVSSFLPDVLTTIHDLDPAIPLGFLCETRHLSFDVGARSSGGVGDSAMRIGRIGELVELCSCRQEKESWFGQ